MTPAYHETYLADARNNLGQMFLYAVEKCCMDPDRFLELFIASQIGEQFAHGIPRYVCGMSGIELVWEVLSRCGMNYRLPLPVDLPASSIYFDFGYYLADYQWYSGRSFLEISEVLPFSRLFEVFGNPEDYRINTFRRTAEEYFQKQKLPTHLQNIRRTCGYSQRTLSEKSGVHLRCIQQYEQRSKDINRCSAYTLSALASALGCRMEDLLESTHEIIAEQAE